MKRKLMFSAALIVAATIGPFINTLKGGANGLKPVRLARDKHFRMLMEGAKVRVWILELGPNERTALVHRDHDFLQVPLNEGWLSTSMEGRQPVPFWVEKKARFVRGGFSQIVQNTDPKALVRLVEVEFTKSIGVERCGPEAQVSCGCFGASAGIFRIFSCGILETDDVSINQFENQEADKLTLQVAPVLVVAVNPVKIQPLASGASAGVILKPGEVLLVDKPTQTIESLDPLANVKAVTVEFKSSSP